MAAKETARALLDTAESVLTVGVGHRLLVAEQTDLGARQQGTKTFARAKRAGIDGRLTAMYPAA